MVVESVKIPVVVGEDEGILEIECDTEGEIVTIKLNNNKVCGLDRENFITHIDRMLELWK